MRRSDKRRDPGGEVPDARPDPEPATVEVVDPATHFPRAYAATPVRPVAQLAARAGLWGAVGIGVAGGLVGLLRPPVQQVEAVVQEPDDAAFVPAPVAGMAELVVQEWLTVPFGREDDDTIDELFVDPPDSSGAADGDLTVERVVTVSGEARHEGYWAVTVAADVVETRELPDDGDDDPSNDFETLGGTWFVEVAIVGDVDGRLAALTTPSVLPAPPDVATGWRPSADRPRPADDGPLSTTVEGFLLALLAGDGDPSRYLAPGGEVEAVSPAPFDDVRLVEMSADELDGGRTRVLATVVATTPGGTTTELSYEILLEEWADRWEIVQFSGAPTLLVGEPPADEEADDAGGDAPAGSDEDGSGDDGTPADRPDHDPVGGNGDGDPGEDPPAGDAPADDPPPGSGSTGAEQATTTGPR